VLFNTYHHGKKEKVFLFKICALLNNLYGTYWPTVLRNGAMPATIFIGIFMEFFQQAALFPDF